MTTFIIGLIILVVGGYLYGIFCEKVFKPDNRETPANTMKDDLDYVPMKKWQNSLIELLNIAGTGPILGPILGALFGPIAFIMIPIGCVLGGAVHDYFIGMMSMRNNGAQMPLMIRKYMGNRLYVLYNIFVCLLMLLVGTVFLYTPGDLLLTQIIKTDSSVSNPVVWFIYGAILLYFLLATMFPIDKIIGKVYPIFGAILLISAVGVLIGIFVKGYTLTNLTFENFKGSHPDGIPLLPTFFVTVACGIVSGFHSSQCTLVSRAVKSEKEGRLTFYYMMIIEGVIAMIWAAAAIGLYNKGIDSKLMGTPSVVGLVSIDLLGKVGGVIAIIGVIVLPITSGDTALRSLRLMMAETFNIDQSKKTNRVIISLIIFIPVIVMLFFAKISPDGFNILWRYFAWSNQTIAVFAFALISVYLYSKSKNFWISLIPGTFYCFIIVSYILSAKIGFNININIANIIGILSCILYCIFTLKVGKRYIEIKHNK